jgi:hypothetical protein
MTPRTLSDVATVIRSKNAGPFLLTLDVFFTDLAAFRKVRDAGTITPERISAQYRIPQSDICEITFFEPAAALKITLKRPVSSAAPGDTDVFGAQQHMPLAGLSWQPEPPHDAGTFEKSGPAATLPTMER